MTNRKHHPRHHESSTEQMPSMKHHHHHHEEPRSSSIDASHEPKRRHHRSRSPSPCRSSQQSPREQTFCSPVMTDSLTASRTFGQISPAPSTGDPQVAFSPQPLQTPFWTFLSVTLTMIFRSLIFRK